MPAPTVEPCAVSGTNITEWAASLRIIARCSPLQVILSIQLSSKSGTKTGSPVWMTRMIG